jgi:hypothetical protein
MPNHCYQSVWIKGPRAVVRHLFDQLTQHDRFCDVVVPMSLEPWLVEDSFDEHGWYGWRHRHWGTKWDVCETNICEPYADCATDEGHGSFSFNCWTAWSPPIPVWERLVALGCEVHTDYEDEGGMFEGTWVNGDDQCWEPQFEEDEDGSLIKLEREVSHA